ncbi:hypothetical protein AB0H86_00960 [Streptomyces sp. NPDC050997]|uniref:hypothetical protein n=1 Tax=Streptomyces sp. NPDC050997 TaxID=3155519 RepID=UPI00341902EF
MSSSAIWFGDLARAVTAVGRSDPETLRAVADLLGVSAPAPGEQAVPPEEPAAELLPPLPPPALGPRADGAPEIPRTSAAVPAVSATVSGAGPRLLTPVARAPRPPVVWTTPSLATASRTGRPVPRQSLLAPRSASAIVQAAASRREPDGDVDIARAVDRLARGLPLRSLPRRPAPTLRFGVQVLVDRGIGMQPFHRDQDDLVSRIRNTVGQDTTQVLHFEDSPLDGAGPGGRWTWRPYESPAPGTRVLVLTDLGLGGPAYRRRDGRAAWECFFDRLTRARCAAVVFLPYPRRRRPAWATGRVRLVPWDRRTTVGWVRMHDS